MVVKIIDGLLEAACKNGARDGVYLPTEQVILDLQFREICRSNGCGRYNRCYMCPPDIGDAGTLMESVKVYPHAFVYQSVSKIEDSFDFEGMMEAGARHAALSAGLQAAAKEILKKEFLHLSSGCRRCQRCAKMDEMPCRHPQQALPSMEGYCVDVYRTVKDTPLRYTNGENTVTYFGMILFSE